MRDTSTGVILNRDDHAKVEYETKRARLRAEKQRQATLDARVSQLEGDIADIKYLLHRLIEQTK